MNISIPLKKKHDESRFMHRVRSQPTYHLAAQEQAVLRPSRPCGWKDAWRVLRGHYEPQIEVWHHTPVGTNVGEVSQILKEVWSSPREMDPTGYLTPVPPARSWRWWSR